MLNLEIHKQQTMNPIDDGYAFTIPDLWKFSTFLPLPWDRNGLKIAGFDALDVNNQNPFSDFKKSNFNLPSLEHFNYGSTESTSTPESVSAYFDVEQSESSVNDDNEDEDVWDFAQHDKIDFDQQKLGTWDRFYGYATKEPVTYFSEAGPHALDAAFSSVNDTSDGAQLRKTTKFVFVQPSRYLLALFNLGLGRESAFFEYRSEKMSFCTRVAGCRLSGYSRVSCESINRTFLHYGNQMCGLKSFIDHAYASSEPFPAMIAFAESVSSVLTIIMEHLTRPAQLPQNLLQLQSLFYRPGLIISYLQEIVSKIRTSKNDMNLLSRIYNWSQDLDHVDTCMRPVVLQLLARTSKPWLEAVESCLGLRSRNPWSTKLFLKYRRCLDEQLSDLTLTTGMMPSFIAEDVASMLVQTSKGLSLLETHTPDHILLRSAINEEVNPPELEWKFGWTDIERIQSKAKLYETNLLQTMKSSGRHEPHVENLVLGSESPLQHQGWPFDIPEDVLQAQTLFFISTFRDLPPGVPSLKEDNPLQKSVEHALVANATRKEMFTFAPPFSMAPMLSFSPIISAQARLMNFACFQLIFKQYRLRSHLSLLRHYQLFGDGVFVSRLSQALLDPELSSSQRLKGHVRTGQVGLNLGSRKSWPPASSELRLALMGILKECFKSTNTDQAMRRPDVELPAGLSFAIRELSQDDIERCLDPNSIEALDFLCIQYKPPPPLDVIFTPSILAKYDSAFKLLLRLTRIIFVTNQLFRNDRITTSDSQHADVFTRRFRIEARHFVSAISSCFFENGINSIWNSFESNLDDLEKRLGNDQLDGCLDEYNSLDQLQEYHEAVLDQIMSTLLLRKRQEKMMKLLEEIFGLILLFAMDLDATKRKDLQSKERSGPKDLYMKFKEKVRLFVGSCRELSKRKDDKWNKEMKRGDRRMLFNYSSVRKNGSDSIDQLLFRLDMNGFYS